MGIITSSNLYVGAAAGCCAATETTNIKESAKKTAGRLFRMVHLFGKIYHGRLDAAMSPDL